MEEQYIIGRNPVIELLKSDTEVDKIYLLKGNVEGSIKKIIGMAKDKGIVVQEVDRQKLDTMADGEVHQGVVALATGYEYYSVEDIIQSAKDKNESPFVVILDSIEDTHNLGAIIRTAECAGVHGVIIPKRRAAMVNQTVFKTSAGAVQHMKIAKVTNISQTIDKLKELGLWIYGADMEGESLYYKSNLTGSIGLIVGGENKGIGPALLNKCDQIISIPMFGEVNSLNASASAAILIYEIVRQRDESNK
ncbi:MAG: 23S rRNA (guanosine(2251)-2'-O)-methyltransferase RlmB [Tissierellia bacterium]|nr:23S rRNA (guanosine(2251)-2'-O)-methyltransferase RlmB [Tissierellia bacterium]